MDSRENENKKLEEIVVMDEKGRAVDDVGRESLVNELSRNISPLPQASTPSWPLKLRSSGSGEKIWKRRRRDIF